jgi:hypothetical protein
MPIKRAKKYRVASAQEILQQVIRQQTILTLIGKMKIRLLVSIIGVVISFALTTLAQQKGAPDPELRQMIDAFAKKYAEAVNNNDAAAIAAFYTEDGVLVTSEGPKGRSPSRHPIQAAPGRGLIRCSQPNSAISATSSPIDRWPR